MALVEKTFFVEITPGGVPPTVHVSEYDVGRKYTVGLTDDGEDYEIPSGTTASIEGTIGENCFTASATVQGNKIKFQLTEAMTAHRGNAWTKIKLVKNGEPVSSCAFILRVDRAGLDLGAIADDDSYAEAVERIAQEIVDRIGVPGTVGSVNGQTGAVVLSTNDIDNDSGYVDETEAAAAAPVQSVNGRTGGIWIRRPDIYPTLSEEQKEGIRSLLNSYYNVRDRFEYEYEHTRNAFAAKSGCWNAGTGKYQLNCNTFAQMILMGRSPVDFKANGDYSNAITQHTFTYNGQTKTFDWGYYADFKMHSLVSGLLQSASSSDPSTRYFNFRNPTYSGSYSDNSYYTALAESVGNQVMNNYMNANDLAYELWTLGCEIPISEVDVGDILFCRDPAPADFYHGQIFWRQIAHTFFVSNKYENALGTDLVLMDCTSTKTLVNGELVDGPCIIRSRLNKTAAEADSWKADRAKAGRMLMNTVFCARHPIAWGITPNVPGSITVLPDAE